MKFGKFFVGILLVFGFSGSLNATVLTDKIVNIGLNNDSSIIDVTDIYTKRVLTLEGVGNSFATKTADTVSKYLSYETSISQSANSAIINSLDEFSDDYYQIFFDSLYKSDEKTMNAILDTLFENDLEFVGVKAAIQQNTLDVQKYSSLKNSIKASAAKYSAYIPKGLSVLGLASSIYGTVNDLNKINEEKASISTLKFVNNSYVIVSSVAGVGSAFGLKFATSKWATSLATGSLGKFNLALAFYQLEAGLLQAYRDNAINETVTLKLADFNKIEEYYQHDIRMVVDFIFNNKTESNLNFEEKLTKTLAYLDNNNLVQLYQEKSQNTQTLNFLFNKNSFSELDNYEKMLLAHSAIKESYLKRMQNIITELNNLALSGQATFNFKTYGNIFVGIGTLGSGWSTFKDVGGISVKLTNLTDDFLKGMDAYLAHYFTKQFNYSLYQYGHVISTADEIIENSYENVVSNLTVNEPSTLTIHLPSSASLSGKNITASLNDEIIISFDKNYYSKDAIIDAQDLDLSYKLYYTTPTNSTPVMIEASFDVATNGLKFNAPVDGEFEIVKLEYPSTIVEHPYITVGIPDTFSSTTTQTPSQSIDLNSGLVAHYEFEGNANDSSGNANHGTEYGGVTYVDGVIGQAGSFDGVDDYINIGDTLDINENNISISVWIKAINYQQYSKIINKGQSNAGTPINSGYSIRIIPPNQTTSGNYSLTFEIIGDDGIGYEHRGDYNIENIQSINNFCLLTGVYDGKNTKFYIDGKLVSSRIQSINYSNTNIPLSIGALHRGAYGNTGEFFNGQIDDLRIYNRALNDSEIQELYKLGSTGTITHNGTTYGTVTSPYTGKVWLDRNLGASQACTALDDTACYGDYYQWGRDYDGHQESNSTTISTQATDINNAGSSFIIGSSDWTNADSDATLRSANWSKTDGSSICPVGFRVPTITELSTETLDSTDGMSNRTDAFNNFLKLPSAGGHNGNSGSMFSQGSGGVMWSSSVSGSYSDFLNILYDNANTGNSDRVGGFSVRCIQDSSIVSTPPLNLLSETPTDYEKKNTVFTKTWNFDEDISALDIEVVSNTYGTITTADLVKNGSSLSVSLTPDTTLSENLLVLRFTDANANVVTVDSSEIFWAKTPLNTPPTFAINQQLQIAGNESTTLMLPIQTYDSDGDNVSVSVKSSQGESATIDANGNLVLVSSDTTTSVHSVVLTLSDSKSSVDKEISVFRFNTTNITSFYSDTDETTANFNYIAFATLKGVVSGQVDPNDSTKRVFRADDNVSWAEALAMVINGATVATQIEMPEYESVLSVYPLWASKYYSFAREHGAIDFRSDDLTASDVTREDIARLLVKTLRLEERMADFPSITLEFSDKDSFTNTVLYNYGQIARAYGLFMTGDIANPTGAITRGELARVIAKIFMIPTATLNIADSIEYGDDLNIGALLDVKAIKVNTSGEYGEIDSRGDISVEYAINGETAPTNTAALNVGENRVIALVSNNGVREFLSTTFVVTFGDVDSDGVQDDVDEWVDDARYSYDDNSNEIPDILDLFYDLSAYSSSDSIVINDEVVLIQRLIDEGGYIPTLDVVVDDNVTEEEEQGSGDVDTGFSMGTSTTEYNDEDGSKTIKTLFVNEADEEVYVDVKTYISDSSTVTNGDGTITTTAWVTNEDGNTLQSEVQVNADATLNTKLTINGKTTNIDIFIAGADTTINSDGSLEVSIPTTNTTEGKEVSIKITADKFANVRSILSVDGFETILPVFDVGSLVSVKNNDGKISVNVTTVLTKEIIFN